MSSQMVHAFAACPIRHDALPQAKWLMGALVFSIIAKRMSGSVAFARRAPCRGCALIADT